MAYKSKYYDPKKAHEYYMKHRKLKGRTSTTANRSSTASLNEQGKAAAAEVKERLDEELKAALKKLPKGSAKKRKALRAEYKEKYLQELDAIKQDKDLQKQTATKKTKAAASGGGSSKRSSGSSGGSSTRDIEGEANKVKDARDAQIAQVNKSKKANIKKLKSQAQSELDAIEKSLENLTPEAKEALKLEIDALIERINTALQAAIKKTKSTAKKQVNKIRSSADAKLSRIREN